MALKVGPQTKTISVIWVLIKHANSQVPPKTYWIKSPREGPSNLCFIELILIQAQVWEPLANPDVICCWYHLQKLPSDSSCSVWTLRHWPLNRQASFLLCFLAQYEFHFPLFIHSGGHFSASLLLGPHDWTLIWRIFLDPETGLFPSTWTLLRLQVHSSFLGTQSFPWWPCWFIPLLLTVPVILNFHRGVSTGRELPSKC